MIGVVVPSRTEEYLEGLLRSLDLPEPTRDWQCVVADNGLSAEFRDRWQSRLGPWSQFTQTPQPFCFATAINSAVALLPDSADILILNDDATMVTNLWCMHAMRLLRDPDCARYGLISLAIDGGVGNPEQKHMSWSESAPVVTETAKTLCFVAVLVRRAAWDQVGPLDERFSGYGCLNAEGRVLLADGRSIKIRDLVRLKHPGPVMSLNERTYSIEGKAITGWWKQSSGTAWVKVGLKRSRKQPRRGWSRQGVVFTPAHEIRTHVGWTRADGLRPGVRVPIGEPRLSPRQREFVLGTVLGDATLCSRNGQRASLSVGHAEKQWGYLDLKNRMLGRWASSMCEYQPSLVRIGATRQRKIASKFSVELADLFDLAYPDGKKKQVSVEWLRQVGPFGFALFYLDDGLIQKGSARLGAYAYGEKGAALIQSRLHELGVGSTLDVDSRRWKYSKDIVPCVLRFRINETRDLMKMIGAYVPPCLRYKTTAEAPAFDQSLWDPKEISEPYDDEVISVDSFTPTRKQVLLHTRYCLTVEDNHNFFTQSGLAHNFDDDDYCNRMRRAGWLCGVTQRIVVAHGHNAAGHSSSYMRYHGQDGMDRLFHENQQRYIDKWGGPPGYERPGAPAPYGEGS